MTLTDPLACRGIRGQELRFVRSGRGNEGTSERNSSEGRYQISSRDVLHDSANPFFRLRIGIRVSGVVDLHEHHHRVVFMNDVVAVDRVAPDEVTKTEEHLRLHVVLQP